MIKMGSCFHSLNITRPGRPISDSHKISKDAQWYEPSGCISVGLGKLVDLVAATSRVPALVSLLAGSGWHVLFTAIGRLCKSGLVFRYRLAHENVAGAKLIQIAAAESLTGSMTPFS